MLASAKIDNFDLGNILFILEQDVFRLEVSVHYFIFMTIRHRRHQLLENHGGSLLGEMVLIHNKVEQFTPWTDFGHDVKVLLVLVEFEDF